MSKHPDLSQPLAHVPDINLTQAVEGPFHGEGRLLPSMSEVNQFTSQLDVVSVAIGQANHEEPESIFCAAALEREEAVLLDPSVPLLQSTEDAPAGSNPSSGEVACATEPVVVPGALTPFHESAASLQSESGLHTPIAESATLEAMAPQNTPTLPEREFDAEAARLVATYEPSHSIADISNIISEEPPLMNSPFITEQSSAETSSHESYMAVASEAGVSSAQANETDNVLHDVQSTLDALAGMAQGLTQQKQAANRLQDELEEWSAQLAERERSVADQQQRLDHLDTHLKEMKQTMERSAEQDSRVLSERSAALKELAESVEARDRTTLKRAEAVQGELERAKQLAATLRTRSSELDDREARLSRQSEELALKIKQLQAAREKFGTIVKSFNETVQFNTTLSAISKVVAE